MSAEKSVTKTVAKNFSWLLSGNIASGLINFLMIVYIARVMGAAAFGLLQFAQAFALYLVILVDPGLSVYGTREIARDRSRAGTVSANIFALRLIGALIVFALSLLILLLIPLNSTVRLLFVITFMFVFYRALNADWVFQGLEKMEYAAISKLLFSALTFGTVVILIKRPEDLVNVPLIQFVFGLAVAVTFLAVLFKKFFPFDLKEIAVRSWPQTFFLAVPLGASSIFLQIYDNLDTIMLGLMATPAIVGIYNAAYRMFYIFAGVLSLWLATLLPVVCKRIAEDKDRTRFFLEKIMRLTMLLVVPVTVIGCLAAPLIIRLFFGRGYDEAVPALKVLIWSLIPMAVSSIYGSLVLLPAGLFNQFLVSVGAGALTNIILNLILIPRFSYIGAALSTIAAQVVAGLVAYYFSRALFRLNTGNYLFKPLAVSLLAVSVFSLTYYLLPHQPALLQLLVSSLVSLAAAGLLLIYLENKFIAGILKEIVKK
jgi:O-antigen/teichoic acid export membrane protein